MPDDHKCLHEIDLALIAERQERSLSLMEEIKKKQQDVLVQIFGNGKEGLHTKIGKIKTKLNVQWALFLFLFGLIGWVIKLH